MQAIILAAGMGKRLKNLTEHNTKCMVEVNGVTLMERMLTQLDSLALRKIIIVVGYKGEELIEFIHTLPVKTTIEFVENPIYDKTNNIYSLYLASNKMLEDDTLLLESDLIFEDSILKLLIEDKRSSLALVDKYESWMDGSVIKLSDDNKIISFIAKKKFAFTEIDSYYKTVNIYKFSKGFSSTHYVPFLTAYQSALGKNEYYEQVLRVLTTIEDLELEAKILEGNKWYEIDDIQDLDIASSIFVTDKEQKLAKIEERFGGYWRYPKMIDFCYLVNPFYPPTILLDEIKANLQTLITSYPSGQKVNSLLAAKNFGIRENQIVVGNGAAELIKSLTTIIEGNIGVIRPTFEEYPNRILDKSRLITFIPHNENFQYNEHDLISYFEDKDVSAIILINPDNPTGNYVDKKGILHIIKWCHSKNILLILDESFVDFSTENYSIIESSLLDQYPQLIVVKSISKSYGVPGLRLGIVATSHTMIDSLKKDVSIWNINSLGEFYLQIESKYHKDYLQSLELLRNERILLADGLASIKSVRVIPSQANYIMVELTGGITSKKVVAALLEECNILIKDLTSKISNGKQYVRIAVRDNVDNKKDNVDRADTLIGVGNIDPNRIPITLTDKFNDFKTVNNFQPSKYDNATIIVVKKNTSVLRRLKEWLKRNNTNLNGTISDLPLLMIDDEADH
ncbi:MAG: aminotransferase class I/II-fold pyridoxal phosphate-dependent enzyme, partial [Spirochaetia bacterium]|nr:aminotransferase class I/II-fold pyridoxal phosphate-dependent enzyme [Spirochaetia bacterium]